MDASELIRAVTDDRLIRQYAERNGWIEVWRSWRDNMLSQGREVAQERMDFHTLSEQDVQLDKWLAEDVVQDFLIWALYEKGLAYQAKLLLPEKVDNPPPREL